MIEVEEEVELVASEHTKVPISGIPEHWELKKLGEVCDKVQSVKRKEKKPSEELLYLDISGIDNVANKITEHKTFTWSNAPSRAQQIVFKGDILFSTVRTYLRNIAQIESAFYDGQIASSGFCVIRAKKGLAEPKYLFLLTLFEGFLQPLSELQTGSSYPAVRDKDVFSQLVPVPPLSEQKAIVAKIEELFSALDKGKQQLEEVRQQLKVYRQAVLKWAFEGKLTNGTVCEGKLPEGWEWVTFNDVCTKIGDIDHKMPKSVESGIPYLSTKDFTDDLKVSFDKAKYISREDFESLGRKIKPEKGDIIFPRYGTIGKNILIDFEMDFLVSYSCAIVKPDKNCVLPEYLYYYSLSPEIRDEIKKYVVETTQANIGIASIKKFVFPLPSMEEQQSVVQEIESRLSVCDKMEETIEQSLLQAETLRQSILKKAFEGRLL